MKHQKSGSLITVDYAQEQHKKILAVPGSIFNETSAGCNSLIYDGCDPFWENKICMIFLI